MSRLAPDPNGVRVPWHLCERRRRRTTPGDRAGIGGDVRREGGWGWDARRERKSAPVRPGRRGAGPCRAVVVSVGEGQGHPGEVPRELKAQAGEAFVREHQPAVAVGAEKPLGSHEPVDEPRDMDPAHAIGEGQRLARDGWSGRRRGRHHAADQFREQRQSGEMVAHRPIFGPRQHRVKALVLEGIDREPAEPDHCGQGAVWQVPHPRGQRPERDVDPLPQRVAEPIAAEAQRSPASVRAHPGDLHHPERLQPVADRADALGGGHLGCRHGGRQAGERHPAFRLPGEGGEDRHLPSEISEQQESSWIRSKPMCHVAAITPADIRISIAFIDEIGR